MQHRKVVFVTDPKIKVAPAAIAAERFEENFAALPEPFPPPIYPPLTIPSEFDTYEGRQTFTVAVHEVGHGLGNLIFCNWSDALTVQFINGAAIGASFAKNSKPGINGACIDLSGMVAEQLVRGAASAIAGAATDIKMARENLRDAGIPEDEIDLEMAAIHKEMQRIFIKDWLPGIRGAATRLAQNGILSPEAFIEILTNAQHSAHAAGTLQKSLDGSRSFIDTLHKSGRVKISGSFESLVKSLATVARDNNRRKAQVFDKAANLKGLSAHEVSKLEALRNHADLRSRGT